MRRHFQLSGPLPCCTRERKASTMSCHNSQSLNQAADNLTKVMECPHYPVNFVQVGYFIQAESLVPYSEKLSREKLSQLSWLFTKVFSTKFGSMVSFGTVKASNPRTLSQWKLYISPIHKSFLPRKFPTTWYRNMQFRKFSIESSTVLCTMPAQQTQCVRMLSLCV